ncbi:MAG TPA: FAD-dependent monooxygenase [Pseudomonadales bacterium]|nr:FAD-dependent monooxygenase [Pseudomonadales bacterium]
MTTTVLIAGAGPVGLTMAIELARYGIPLRIIDKAPARTDKSKALVVWSRSLELLERAGCCAALVNAGVKTDAVNIIAGEKSIAHLKLDGIESKYPYGLMIPQSETERVLDEFLKGLGVTIERSVELIDFTSTDDKVTSTLQHADGRRETIETAWLIGCDGAHSTVRHKLGKEFHGETMLIDWILADVHLKNMEYKTEVTVVWHADGVLALFPIADNRYRVIADVGATKEGGGSQPDPTLADVQAVLDKRLPRVQAMDPVWLSAFRINERKVADYRAGRAFLAGDAAHVHSPAGGQGMNTGMQDACNLAWKLALVAKGTASGKLLDSYTLERSPIAEQVLKVTGRMTHLATMTGGISQFLRNHTASLLLGLHPVRKLAAGAASEISIGYPDSLLSVTGKKFHGNLSAGKRAPIRDGESPVGAGNQPLFVLFADEDATTLNLIKQYSALLEPAIRPPYEPGGMWLVRPDGYIGVAAVQGDTETVANYLGALK